MNMRFTFLPALFLALTACNPSKNTPEAKAGTDTSVNSQKLNDDQIVTAALYNQHAGEYSALCLQAYSLAKLRLNENLKTKSSKPLAVVTDLDETALDNSAFYGWAYRNNTTYTPTNWAEWCKAEKADSMAGSVAFFKYADSKKVDIYYISNRDTSLVTATMNNMKALGYPQIEKSHFLFKEGTSSKQPRRDFVATTHNIVLLLGDNLNDFDSVYEKQNNVKRRELAVKASSNWGEKFIAFPNAMYGDWDVAIYNYDHKLNIHQIDSVRLADLKSYK